ncbi:MAG: hypothetical protein K2J95_03305 [Lachnospiraceae bacterium]|nr:hypothetical protein [Lachnospiraceae bacterium]
MMLFHQGLGETCIFSRLMKAYTEKTKKPLILIARDDSRKALLEQCPYIYNVMTCDISFFYELASYKEFRAALQIKNFETLHYINFENVTTMREEICSFLGLPYDAEDSDYIVKSKFPDALGQYFDELGLKRGKSVFLIPHALCYGNEVVSFEFWEKLSIRLREEGYEPVFNSCEEIVPGVPYIYLPIEEVPAFAKLCGNVIGVRTGLLDVIATFTDVKIQAVYPNELCPIWHQNQMLYKGLDISLKEKSERAIYDMAIRRVVGRGNVFEFIHGNEEEDIQKLIEHLDVIIN